MKRTLVALAALASVSAFAQSSVTVFGVADLAYRTSDWTNAGVARAHAAGVTDGAMAGNRFGFRGTEDLGGGMKANFHIEHGISYVSNALTDQRQASSGLSVALGSADSGRSAAVNRQSWAGLSGGFGEVRLGYQYTNLYEISTLSGFNSGSEGTHGADTAHTMNGGGAWGGTRANGVTYTSPAMGGFTLTLQHGGTSDQESYQTTGASAGYSVNRTSVRLTYANGPLKVMYGNTSYSSATSAAGSMTVGASTTAKLDQLGASYNFGPASVSATWGDGGDGKASPTNSTGQQIGVKVPMGNATFIVTTGNFTSTLAGAKTVNVSQQQIGVTYALSKRSTLYLFNGTTKDAGTAATSVDKKANTIVGMLHTF